MKLVTMCFLACCHCSEPFQASITQNRGNSVQSSSVVEDSLLLCVSAVLVTCHMAAERAARALITVMQGGGLGRGGVYPLSETTSVSVRAEPVNRCR